MIKKFIHKLKKLFVKEEKVFEAQVSGFKEDAEKIVEKGISELKEEAEEIIEKIEYQETRFARWGYSLIRWLFAPLVKWLWIHEVEGLENIPKNGACIIASNHESYFDFICFIAASPRKIHYLAAEKFFKNKFWLPLVKVTGQIKVDRESKDKRATHHLVYSALKQERMIGIFPEGTRSPDGNLQKAYTGVAKFALKARVPIIPVGLIGTGEILAKHQKLPRLKKSKIRIGEPIYLDEHYDKEHDEPLLREVTDNIMHKIAKLSDKEYPHGENNDNISK